MASLPAPTPEQLGWLSREPPRDDQDQPIIWTLADCRINEVKWAQPIIHDHLRLERVQFTAAQWDRPVFRNCLLRGVSFARTTFSHARFEGVVFESCSFEGSTFEVCALDNCRFNACELRFTTMLRTQVQRCVFTDLDVTVLELRECDLSDSKFVTSKLHGPRVTRTTAATLELEGGELRGADLTACTLDTLRLTSVAVEGLRVIDCELGAAELHGGRVAEFSMSGTQAKRLLVRGCSELPGPRLLDCRIETLQLEACLNIPSLLIADCVLGALIADNVVLYDAAFERVEVEGHGLIRDSTVTGVLFNAGRWTHLQLTGASVKDYVAVDGAHFQLLSLEQLKVDDSLQLRLAGDTYGDGSMTWGDARGA
ncbi:pentapeptide repeat-containing protein [Enhygromyxa salina]|uniref:pentapeptide repeat-containing protein n=1 Tax=Enhygromyxa salina TaxID=215803 RepID=UPI0015E78462|nr:pentapeptide repeat-containing protein [Enhygromyxa salina]